MKLLVSQKSDNTHLADPFVAWLPFITFFICGISLYAFRAIDFFSAVPGDLGDARFNSVILEHLFRWITGQEKSLWNPQFFFPFEGVLAFSDNHFGSALSYILLRLAGLARETAFDGWFLIGNCLNYIAAYIAIRRIGIASFGAAAGAFVFAFGLPVLPKDGYAQLIYRFAIPLAYAAFLEMFSTKRLYVLWRVILWTTVQFYCSIYLGIFLVYLLAATLAAILIVGKGKELLSSLIFSIRSESRMATFFSATASALCVCAVFCLLYKYHAISVDYVFARSKAEIATMLPRLSSYLFADGALLSAWPGRLLGGVPMRHEHQMFFGFGVWIIGAYGATMSWRARQHQELGKIASLSLAFLFLVTISIGGFSVYLLLTSIPGISAIRAVSRIVLVMMLPVALLVALGSENLLRRASQHPGLKYVAAFALVFILSVEVATCQPNNTPISKWIARQTALRKALPAELPADPILFVYKKDSEPFFLSELDSMILAQDMGIPTLNGYSGYFPPGYIMAHPCLPKVIRLYGYSIHRRIPMSAMDLIAGRVVTIVSSPCDGGLVVPFTGTISAALAKQIKLRIENIRIVEGRLNARIDVTNVSTIDFNTVSADGKHVRLSWRFIALSAVGQHISNPRWDTRKELIWKIPPGDSRSIDMSLDLPLSPGSYLLEVSLVQEHVAWFHDLGMPVANVPIKVGSAR
jgi:hypothetical protein